MDDPLDIALDDSRPKPRISDSDVRKAWEELNSALDALKQEGESAREHLLQEWDANVKFFEGYQWDRQRPGNLATVTLNNMLRIAVQQAAYVSDTKPVYTVKSQREEFNQLAAMLEAAAQAVWSNHGHELLIPRSSIYIDIFGKAFWKVIWRQDLYRGLGDVSIELVDPIEVLVDDVNDLSYATFICHRQVKPLWWVKMTYPHVAHLVAPDDIDARYTTPLSRPTPRSSALQGRGAVERVVVEEWLIRDPTPVDEIPGTGVGVQEGYHPKYPAGRLITRIGEGSKVIAQDIPYPWWDPWPGPWVEMSSPKVRGFWPIPPFSQIRVLQEAYNLMFSLGLDQARTMSQGIWVVSEGAMRPEAIDQLRSMTSGVVTVKPGHEVRREVGPGIDSGLLEYIRMLNQAMEFIMGLMDVSYGRVPRGIQAGAALEALQAAGQAVVRLRTQEIEKALRDAGWRVIARVAQFYNEKRILVLTGADGSIITKVFDPEAKGDIGSPEELMPWLVLQVQSTSEMALSKDKAYALHAALYGMGAIDRKALLDALEYPNRDEIVKRMERAEQLGVGKAAAGPTPRGRGVKIVEKMLPD